MTLRAVFGRLAVPAAALLLAGCVGGQMAGLPETKAPPAAAANGSAPASGPQPDADLEIESHRAADAQIALAPVPAVPPPDKPATGRPAICGSLDAGKSGLGLVDSQGRRFNVQCFRADVAAPAPAVIILHGLHGIGRSTIYARLAEALNERGIHAFVFQYLTPELPSAATKTAKGPAKSQPKTAMLRPATQSQAGGKVVAPAKTAPKSPGVESAAQARAISDAIAAVQALDYVDHRQIGMFGLSLGGFHSLALAARDERIGAVVNMFGAMPRAVAPEVTRMPPVLILHGDRDAIVPVRRAHELDRLLKKIGARHEMKIYKGQGHSFRGAADADSLARSVDFFEKWLGSTVAASGAG
jgi:dienelactone hydrolase